MSDDIDDIDDLDPDELEEVQEQLEEEIEEHERRLRELRIEQQRKEAEIRCLEYVEFRRACEEAVEDQPTMRPGTDPLLN